MKTNPLQRAGIAYFAGDGIATLAGASPLDPSASNTFLLTAGALGLFSSACYFVCGSSEDDAASQHPIKAIGQHVGNWSIALQGVFFLASGLMPKGLESVKGLVTDFGQNLAPMTTHIDWSLTAVGLSGIVAISFPTLFRDPAPEQEKHLIDVGNALTKGDFGGAAYAWNNMIQQKKAASVFMCTNILLSGPQIVKLVHYTAQTLTHAMAQPIHTIAVPALLLTAGLSYLYGNTQQAQAARPNIVDAAKTLLGEKTPTVF